MRTSIVCVALVLLASIPLAAQDAPFAGKVSVRSPGPELHAEMLRAAADEMKASGAKEVWVGYELATRDEMKNVRRERGHNGSYTMSRNGVIIQCGSDGIERIGSSPKALLYLFAGEGRPQLKKVTFLEMDDAYRFTIPLVWFGKPATALSMQSVEVFLKDCKDEDIEEDLLVHLAFHPGSEPLNVLEDVARRGRWTDSREDAVFWLGYIAGPTDLERIIGLESALDKEDLREELAFVYYNINTDPATRRLFHLAKNDRSDDVREEALFWLGNRAGKILTYGMDDLTDDEDEAIDVKKKAIFSLSQMDTGKSREALLKVAKTSEEPSLRKAAIFWLCQEGYPEVLDLLEEIIFGK